MAQASGAAGATSLQVSVDRLELGMPFTVTTTVTSDQPPTPSDRLWLFLRPGADRPCEPDAFQLQVGNAAELDLLANQSLAGSGQFTGTLDEGLLGSSLHAPSFPPGSYRLCGYYARNQAQFAATSDQVVQVGPGVTTTGPCPPGVPGDAPAVAMPPEVTAGRAVVLASEPGGLSGAPVLRSAQGAGVSSRLDPEARRRYVTVAAGPTPRDLALEYVPNLADCTRVLPVRVAVAPAAPLRVALVPALASAGGRTGSVSATGALALVRWTCPRAGDPVTGRVTTAPTRLRIDITLRRGLGRAGAAQSAHLDFGEACPEDGVAFPEVTGPPGLIRALLAGAGRSLPLPLGRARYEIRLRANGREVSRTAFVTLSSRTGTAPGWQILGDGALGRLACDTPASRRLRARLGVSPAVLPRCRR